MYVYLGKKGQDREEEDGRRDEERIKNFQRDNQIDPCERLSSPAECFFHPFPKLIGNFNI